MRADAESSCTASCTDSWSQDGARNPWSAPTTELWAPTASTTAVARSSNPPGDTESPAPPTLAQRPPTTTVRPATSSVEVAHRWQPQSVGAARDNTATNPSRKPPTTTFAAHLTLARLPKYWAAVPRATHSHKLSHILPIPKCVGMTPFFRSIVCIRYSGAIRQGMDSYASNDSNHLSDNRQQTRASIRDRIHRGDRVEPRRCGLRHRRAAPGCSTACGRAARRDRCQRRLG